MRIPEEERFWSKVDRSGGPYVCWEWKAGRNKDGYGRFKVGGKKGRAHRHAWELVNGPIPAGLHMLHRCDNPGCVNPAHLFPGTPAANMADMEQKGRGNHPRGGRVGTAKLTEAQVAEIRALYTAGSVTLRELGARFRVSQTAICNIVHGKSWEIKGVT